MATTHMFVEIIAAEAVSVPADLTLVLKCVFVCRQSANHMRCELSVPADLMLVLKCVFVCVQTTCKSQET